MDEGRRARDNAALHYTGAPGPDFPWFGRVFPPICRYLDYSAQVDAEAELGAAEDAASAGRFAEAGARLTAAVPELIATERPELLARAAWVAAICSLAGQRMGEFRAMAAVAGEAVELAASPEARRELEGMARRVEHMVRIADSEHPDVAMRLVFHSHVLLLAEAKSDPRRWALVDADRIDWPHLFAAMRERGGPSRLEVLIASADTDGVGAVVLAVMYGLGPGASIASDELAALCFREADAVAVAGARIDTLCASGHLVAQDGRVRLADEVPTGS